MPEQTNTSIWRGGASPSVALTLVLGLTCLFAGLRASGMLGPAGLRWLLPFGFCLMTIMPWVLMTPDGRRQIGLTRPPRLTAYVQAVAFGVLAALACFTMGIALFGRSTDNWFVSVANNYRLILDISGFTLTRLHLVFTLPALVLSPIGEEIFFRGLLQRTLEQHFSVTTSSAIESAAFGLVHVLHHGLLLTAAGVFFRPVSGTIWIVLMTLVALLLAWLRKRNASLYPSMAAHSAFNLTMNVAIFAALW